MKLGVIMNTNDPETAWNGLRLCNEAIAKGNEAGLFLLGSGVEIVAIEDKAFNVAEVLKKFLDNGGNLLACGSCLEIRHQEASACPISTMAELLEMITDSDKIVTLG